MKINRDLMKNKTSIQSNSLFGHVGLLNKKIAPYTKFSVGLSVALALAVSENQVIRNIGVGIGIASFLQLHE